MNSSGAALLNGALIGALTIVRASRYSMAAVLAGVKTSSLHLRQSQICRLLLFERLVAGPAGFTPELTEKTAVYPS